MHYRNFSFKQDDTGLYGMLNRRFYTYIDHSESTALNFLKMKEKRVNLTKKGVNQTTSNEKKYVKTIEVERNKNNRSG